jgi:hypothetical protein
MKKINLIIENEQNNTLNDFQNLTIEQLNTIFPCSVSILYTGNINVIPSEHVQSLLDAMVDKVSPGGQIVFGLINYKKTCYAYINGGIDENAFFAQIKKINNRINIVDIAQYCQKTQKINLSEAKKNNDIITVTLTKVGI